MSLADSRTHLGIFYCPPKKQSIGKGLIEGFSTAALQVLFAPAFSLAPLLAFINNVIEIRTSGYKMSKGYQRPRWKKQESIGAWFAVLNILGVFAVITNATSACWPARPDLPLHPILLCTLRNLHPVRASACLIRRAPCRPRIAAPPLALLLQ